MPRARPSIDPVAAPALPSKVEDCSTPRTARIGKSSLVVDLARARTDLRLRECRTRLAPLLETNRKALAHLFQHGVIYTRHGARLGRDLLFAHQQLLKVSDLLARVDLLMLGGKRCAAEVGRLCRRVQGLMARSAELTARSDGVLARER